MKQLVLLTLAGLTLAGASVGTAAAASPTFRMSIVHYFRGCHVWRTSKQLGPAATITVQRGTRIEIRLNCPMDFDFAQTAGPKLNLGNRRTLTGQSRVIAFAKPGLYKLTAKNVQTSDEVNLETLGPDNTLSLTVRVQP